MNPHNKKPKKILRNILTLSLVLCASFSMTACKKKEQTHKAADINFKTQEFKEVTDIEQTNYVKDAQIFDKINRLSIENQKEATTAKQRSVVILKYMEDIYKLASKRVSSDLGDVYMYSDTYQNYIATLQSYCEYYGRDIKNIKEHIQDKDFDQDKQPTFVVLGDMESFWTKILKQVD